MYEENQLDILLFRADYLKQKNYWIKKMAGEFDPIDIFKNREIYRDRTRETVNTAIPPVAARIEIPINDELSRQIIKLAKDSDLSIYILLLSALKALLYRYTANKDIISVSPVYKLKAGKKTLNNRVFIRDTVTGDMIFKDLVLNLRSSVLEAYENQDYPYDKLLEYLFPLSSPGEKNREDKPVVSHILCWYGNIHRDKEIEEIKARLSFGFSREERGIVGNLLYDAHVYRESEIRQLSTHLVNLLNGACRDINARISAIEVLTAAEKKQLLVGFNNNRADISRDKPLHWRIREQVTKTPDAVAVACEDRQITYNYLDKRTNQLTARLRTFNPREDLAVGILLNRSLPMAESILAAWQTGCAYIPLDTNEPVLRLQEILADSASPVLITQTQWVNSQLEKAYEGNILLLDEPQEQKNQGNNKNIENLNLNTFEERLAYIIYTSGSTGKPKGAMVEHKGMMNHIHAKINDLQITAKSIIAQNASHTFDISVWQFFTALTRGGKSIIYPHEWVAEPARFIAGVIDHQVTVLEVVPSYLAHMFEFLDAGIHRFASLAYLLVTGETVKPALVKQWFETYPPVKMVNAYGPTEASDDITHFIMDKPLDMDMVPIGKSLNNLNIYILDEHMNLCPPGVTGEICVSGVGVGRGYLNNPELTAEKFNDQCPMTNDRLYKTGDLGCWLPDGTVAFLGRKDEQVKIRGFRIELGEIENHLLTHGKIKEAIVLAREDQKDKYLCAYIVAQANEINPIDSSSLREYLYHRLPGYMVPSYFVLLEKIPLTPHGKVDRKGLPAPGLEREIGYVAPRDAVEKKLVDLWSEILGIEKEKISINANFFHLGGHSLKATVLASRIHKELNINVPLSGIFKTPNIRGLTEYIKDAARSKYIPMQSVEKKEYYPLSSAQRRLYLARQMDEQGIGYNIPSAWEIKGHLDDKKFESVFHGLIRRHESLRTFFTVVNDEPVQRIHDESVIGRWSLVIGEAGKSQVDEIIKNFIKSFDLSRAPLLRVGLIKTEPEKFILMVDMHHIISDGLSTEIYVKEFMELYPGKELPHLKLQYKDYSTWQNRNYGKEYIKQQEIYWLNQFDGEIPVLNLPTDYSRPANKNFAGHFFAFELPAERTTAVKELAAREGATVNMVLLTFFNILLWKLSGQEDIVVGMATAGRRHQDLEQVVGVFINMMAIRSCPRADITFIHYLKEIIKITLDAYDNQDYPFDDLVNKLVENRPINRHPLFDVSFGMQNLDIPGIEIPGLKLEPFQYDARSSRFDLTMLTFEIKDHLFFNVEYDTNLFKKGTIESFCQCYRRIIDCVTRDPQQSLKDIEIIPEEENLHLLSLKKENKSSILIDFEM